HHRTVPHSFPFYPEIEWKNLHGKARNATLGVVLGANHVKVFAREWQRGFQSRFTLGIEFGPKIGRVSTDNDERLTRVVALLKQG
ncbi:MAG: hypothetical protein KGS61_01155, partial [Verrucomicrobia bacterium]|nr:hypothetical protein [Verrucomicrobiota bacterium]